MATSNRAIRAGSGNHAVRRNSFAARQPLESALSVKRNVLVVTVLIVGLALLMAQNRVEISEFLNRSVNKIRIENQLQRISEAELSRLLSSFMGSGFFDFSLIAAKRELELHPWVLQATVKRIWPDTLSLQLVEQVAIARWGEKQLVNQYGELFEPREVQEPGSLPLLTGPEDSQEMVMQHYQKLNQILFPAGLRLSGLRVSKRGSWEYLLNEGMQVAAGRKDVFEKTQRFVKFYQSQPLALRSQFVSVDLRYGNGIAVRGGESEFTGMAIR